MMQIDIKGRNVPVTDEMRARVTRRLEKISRQVSPLARAELEISREQNPSIAAREIAEATLHLKGATLRAREASEDMQHSLNLVTDELARQVKRHRDKRRRRREQRAAAMPERQEIPPLPQPVPAVMFLGG
jgi:putative sigma-54 modulation protein